MNLSEHFTLEELTFSEVALRRGLQNEPPAWAVANLTRLAVQLLEPARSILGVPLHVNSGFRSFAVNSAVGGASNSAHTFGRAADLLPIGRDLHECFDALRASDLPFDQIIFECDAWIHIAVAAELVTPRRQALVAAGAPGHWTYRLAPPLQTGESA